MTENSTATMSNQTFWLVENRVSGVWILQTPTDNLIRRINLEPLRSTGLALRNAVVEETSLQRLSLQVRSTGSDESQRHKCNSLDRVLTFCSGWQMSFRCCQSASRVNNDTSGSHIFQCAAIRIAVIIATSLLGDYDVQLLIRISGIELPGPGGADLPG